MVKKALMLQADSAERCCHSLADCISSDPVWDDDDDQVEEIIAWCIRLTV